MKCKVISIFIFFCFIILCNVANADEGSFSLCTMKAYGIQYDESADKVFVLCIEDPTISHLISFDPDTLEVDKTFSPPGNIGSFLTIDNGQKILICMMEVDGDVSTTDGELLLLDYETGNEIQSLDNVQSMMKMAIDSSETNVYITAIGDKYDGDPGKVLKVRLSDFQILNEVYYDYYTNNIILSPDNSRIYVETSWLIVVFNTSDLSVIDSIVFHTSPPRDQELSADGEQLYVTSRYWYYKEGALGDSLYVFDTSDYQIEQTLRFTYDDYKVSTDNSAYDDVENKLYANAHPLDDEGNVVVQNLIIEINLSDYSYSYFTIGSNLIGRIAIAETQTGKRLFAIEQQNPVIHYKDL